MTDPLAGLNFECQELEDGTLLLDWNQEHWAAIELGWNERTTEAWEEWLFTAARDVIDAHDQRQEVK